MRKVFKYIPVMCRIMLVYFISIFIPKNKKLWVFGAWQGKLYADNTKYLFEYINEYDKDIQCVWLSYKPEIVELLQSKGYRAYNIHSFNGWMSLMRAGIFVETEGKSDIGGYKYAWTKTIQLWHGMGPKRMDWNPDDNRVKRFLLRFVTDNYKSYYWMMSSERGMHIFANDLDISRIERSFVTGYPRNDIFALPKEKSKVREMLDEQFPASRKILYMPTHRNFGTEEIPFSREQLTEVDELLKDNDIVMVFKPHFHEMKAYLSWKARFTNIVFATDPELYGDVYSYISDFDLLISDYSSVMYDFLATHKPIVVFPYDLDHYKSKDAGIFDYYEAIPVGPFCFDWQSVILNVCDLLNADPWKEMREKCRMEFHPFDDGKNSERILRCIKQNVLKLK